MAKTKKPKLTNNVPIKRRYADRGFIDPIREAASKSDLGALNAEWPQLGATIMRPFRAQPTGGQRQQAANALEYSKAGIMDINSPSPTKAALPTGPRMDGQETAGEQAARRQGYADNLKNRAAPSGPGYVQHGDTLVPVNTAFGQSILAQQAGNQGTGIYRRGVPGSGNVAYSDRATPGYDPMQRGDFRGTVSSGGSPDEATRGVMQRMGFERDLAAINSAPNLSAAQRLMAMKHLMDVGVEGARGRNQMGVENVRGGYGNEQQAMRGQQALDLEGARGGNADRLAGVNNAAQLQQAIMREQAATNRQGMVGDQAQLLELVRQTNPKNTAEATLLQKQLASWDADKAQTVLSVVSKALENDPANEQLRNSYNTILQGWMKSNPAARAALMDERDAARATGGVVERYAAGGPVSGIQQMADTGGMQGFADPLPAHNPVVAKYGQYLTMAKQMGLPPLSLDQFMQTQQAAQMQARAAQDQMGAQAVGTLLAEGGFVQPSVGGFLRDLVFNRGQSPQERAANDAMRTTPRESLEGQTMATLAQRAMKYADGGELPRPEDLPQPSVGGFLRDLVFNRGQSPQERAVNDAMRTTPRESLEGQTMATLARRAMKYADGGALPQQPDLWARVRAALVGGQPQQPQGAIPTQQPQERMNQAQRTGQAIQQHSDDLDSLMKQLNNPRGYNAGGGVDVSGRKVLGVGAAASTGPKSDTIPAMIDGSQPAALDSGEYVIPAAIVKKLGTDYFDKLIGKSQSAKA